MHRLPVRLDHVAPWARMTMCALLVVLNGCEAILSPSRYGEVRVTIATASGAPAPGAAVVLYTGQRPIEYAYTDAAGVYLFERVTAGNYGVVARLPRGFVNLGGGPSVVQDDLQVAPGARREVAFSVLACSGTVTVTVRNESGAPAVGVQVILYDAVSTLDAQPTGADGVRRFASVPCGEFGVRLEERAGYVVTPGRGTSFVDGLRISPTVPDVAVSLSVRSAPPPATRASTTPTGLTTR